MPKSDSNCKECLAEVVGCYYYHGVSGHYVGEALRLVRETNNIHDPNAIAVHSMDGRIVGHLSRNTAAYLARDLDSGATASVIVTAIDFGSGGQTSRKRESRPPRLTIRISHLLTARPLPASQTIVERIPDSSPKPQDQPCFILTAAFGSEIDPVVRFFRSWRDNTLRPSRYGCYLIRIYWMIGPIGARVLQRLPVLRETVRHVFCLLWLVLHKYNRM